MKIIHFDEMFHPEFGYQINVLPKFQAMEGNDVYIVTGNNIIRHPMFAGFGDMESIEKKDREYQEQTGVKIVRLPTWGNLSSRVIFKRGFIKYVDSLKPDILFCHFHDTVAGTAFVKHEKKANYPIVFDSHMLEMASKNKFSRFYRFWYKHFITPLIIRNSSTIIRTQDDPYVEKCLGIPLSQAPFISFGTDTTLFHPDSKIKGAFRSDLNISPDDFVVLYTGKLDESKGGMLLAKAFEKKFPSKTKDIILVVVGNTRGEYGKEVDKLFEASENRIIRFPTQKYVDLPKFYQAADLSIFPKQCSLSFYDAQACGLPVISEDNHVNRDRVRFGNGTCFRAGDVENFREKIRSYFEMKDTQYNCLKDKALNHITSFYDYRIINHKYMAVMEKQMRFFEAKRNGLTRTTIQRMETL